MMRRMMLVGMVAVAVAAGCGPNNDDGDGNGEPDATPTDTASDAGDVGPPDTSDAGEVDGGDDSDDLDGGPEDTRDTTDGGDDDGNDADTGPADGGDVAEDGGQPEDTGPSCEEDDDADGLPNCEEINFKCPSVPDLDHLDPNDGDTDGDGLGDLEELQKQTNPCKADSDGDGADDDVELQYGLDPNDPSSYDDGTLDGDRWILEACSQPIETEPVNFHKSSPGNWTIALPPAFGNYTNLSLTGTSAPDAGALYDDPANEVAGSLVSMEPSAGQPGPEGVLRGTVRSAISSVGSVEDGRTGGEFKTHDDKRAAIGRYLIETSDAESVRKFREDLLLELAPYSKSQVSSGLVNTSGAKYRRFRVFFSVIYRSYSTGDQVVVSTAIAPNTKYENRQSVKFRMDDLSNTTNIAEEVDSHLPKCKTFKAGEGTPKAEFYWVLDQSGSMRDDNQKVADFASQFEQEVRNTSLDYRLGVTNMDVRNGGRMRIPPGWHTSASTFSQEIQGAVIDCGGAGSAIPCDGADEHGLEAASQGLQYMKGLSQTQPSPAERIRSDAEVITIFMSDEEANCIKNGSESSCQTLSDYRDFFPQHTIAFSIVGNGDDCGTDDGAAYKEVALETGGKFASLCAEDLTQTIRDIIFAATGITSEYVLPQTPISSSLRVYLNGQWVPRSREDGFEYFAQQNAIAFFGSWRPSERQSQGQDHIAVSYETFKDRCKEADGRCTPDDDDNDGGGGSDDSSN